MQPLCDCHARYLSTRIRLPSAPCQTLLRCCCCQVGYVCKPLAAACLQQSVDNLSMCMRNAQLNTVLELANCILHQWVPHARSCSAAATFTLLLFAAAAAAAWVVLLGHRCCNQPSTPPTPTVPSRLTYGPWASCCATCSLALTHPSGEKCTS